MKKKLKKTSGFRSAFLGAAVVAAGALVSAPAFLPTTTFAATEAVNSVTASETNSKVDVTWNIRLFYKNADGTTRPVKSSDGSDFKVTRTATFTAGDKSSVVELAGYKPITITGYTPDKSYVDGIKVTSTSKPQDVNVYYTENPENKKTYDTETKTISRVITFYRNEGSGKSVQTWRKTQSATLSRLVITYGDGRKEYGEWQSYTFAGMEVPAMEGYLPDIKVIRDVTATPDKPPKDVNVNYYKSGTSLRPGTEIDEYTVTFTDGFGKTLKTESVMANSSATAPAAPVREGYTFAGWDTDFSKVRGNLTVKAKWSQNKTEQVSEKKVVRRTISYYYSNGNPVISSEGRPASTYDEKTFIRYGMKDKVTGKINWGDWPDALTMSEVTPINISGYTPDIKKISSTKVTHNSKSWEVKVYYTKNSSKPAPAFTGFKTENGQSVYYKNGVVDKSLNGLKKSTNGNWYYYSAGKQDKSYNTIAKLASNGKWYYVKNGKIDFTYTGMVKYPKTGRWYYVRKGVFDSSFTGVVKYPVNGRSYYFKKGIMASNYSGNIKQGNVNYKVTKGVAVIVK